MAERAPAQSAEPGPDFDVIVIGGGVNGSGVARDCTLRGLKVAVYERNDIAFGASGNSSGMIHGGPRYLLSNPDVTHTSCLDSGHIQHIAPHLLFRIPFLMPVHRERRGARSQLTLMDAFFGLYDRYQPLKRGKPHARLTADELQRLEPGLAGQTVGGISFDEWGIDGVRLCVANLVDARERGAEVHVHTTVTEIQKAEGTRPLTVRFRNLFTGHTGKATARVVVNATGAWAPITAALGLLPPKAARVRPGKGIHVAFDRRLSNYAVAVRAIDGRQVFLMPWQNMSVIGTTDTDYYGDLDACVATTAEVRYLVQAVERVIPAIRSARAIATWAGVRPTLYEWGPDPDNLSRDHQVVDHAAHGVPGLYSMLGGKLASFRLFAEEMTNLIARHLLPMVPDLEVSCRTHRASLPGGDESVEPLRLAEGSGISPIAASRLEYRHGGRSLRVLERIARSPREATVVCPCEPVLEAEIRYVVRHEWARTVHDVGRRTRLGWGACGGMRCAARCGAIVAEQTGASPVDGQRMALEFLDASARRRVSAVGPQQARQEALALASVRAQLGTSELLERAPGGLGPLGFGVRTAGEEPE